MRIGPASLSVLSPHPHPPEPQSRRGPVIRPSGKGYANPGEAQVLEGREPQLSFIRDSDPPSVLCRWHAAPPASPSVNGDVKSRIL